MPAMSSGFPAYGRELYCVNASLCSGVRFSIAAGVRTRPGATPLHRMPYLPYCVAMYLVRLITPALLMPYNVPRKSPRRPPIEATFIIVPSFFSFMYGSADCTVAIMLRRFICITSSKYLMSKSPALRSFERSLPPTLLTTQSMAP